MRRTLNTLVVATIAATALTTAPSAPAFAGGQISISIIPQKQEHKDAMKLGLGILSVVQGNVTQKGDGNKAGLAQNGAGNNGLIFQEGDNHTGALVQNGNNNHHALLQLGEGTNGHVGQNGNETGATIQFGWK